jgi:sulfate adenylyltransferase subunit 1 (EFTu-like GTPase family)
MGKASRRKQELYQGVDGQGRPLLGDPNLANRQTGAFILVDESTNRTVAAGMIVRESVV